MIKVSQNNNTTVLRNLEEQVLKNKQDIAKHYEMDRALSNLGIRILGTLVSAENLPGLDEEVPFPAAPNYTGEFGDTYAVRTANWTADEPDYNYYVFTRANLNVGEPNDYWLNVGKIGIQGDQGPRGEQGIQGIPGEATRWYSGSFIPTTAAQEGDMFLVTSAASNGDVYRYTNNQWVKQTNLRGAQGLQGDRGPRGEQGIKGEKGNKGERGEPGRPFSIAGVLASIDYLPIPTSENRDKAYLVENAGLENNYNIYFIVGSEESGYLWHNAGEFATIQGPQGNTGDKGEQGIPGLSIFRSTATSIVNNTIPLSSITNLAGREVRVGDSVLFKSRIHTITAVNGNTLTVSQSGNDLQGDRGPQGEKGEAGINSNIVVVPGIGGFGGYNLFFHLPYASTAKRIVLLYSLSIAYAESTPRILNTESIVLAENGVIATPQIQMVSDYPSNVIPSIQPFYITPYISNDNGQYILNFNIGDYTGGDFSVGFAATQFVLKIEF